MLRAIDTGVTGFLGKSRPVSEMLAAVRQAANGEIVMPSTLLLGLLARTSRAAGHPRAELPLEPLTIREQEILRLMARGKSGAAIAAELSISELTVRTHIRNLMAKLAVHSRLEAVAVAQRVGLIQPPS